MKQTLLELTQKVLSAIDSDEINSIDDTIESQQAADIIHNVYLEMIDGKTWPHLKKLIQLDSLSDPTKPNYLKIQEGMKELILFKYDSKKLYNDPVDMKEVSYKYPDEFLRLTAGRKTSQGAVVITDFSGTSLYILNNQAPQFWTSFDDNYIVCDAYNASIEDTLRSNKTQVLAYMEPVWTHLDGAVPDLPSEAFSLLLSESISTAAFRIRQSADQKAEQVSRRQKQWLSRRDWKAHGGVRYPNYGRTGRK